jgi:hypothetical protein
MNIQDILRGLPFPMQGALMQMYGATANQQPQQNAGGGRGFVNPPLVNPNAAPPQMQRVQPTGPVQVPKDEAGFEDVIARIMAGGSTDELQNAPAAEATPVQQAMQPDLPAPAASDAAFEAALKRQQEPPAPEGLLSRFGFENGNQAIGAIGAALAAAGSQDPVKTALAIQAQRSEEAKIAEARRRANMPKVDPITGTPFFQITYPDGRMETVNNPALAKFYQEQSASKAQRKEDDMRLQAKLNAEAAGGKAADKLATETLPDVTQARSNIGELRGIASEIGTLNKDGTFTKTTDNVSGPIAGTAAAVPIIGPTLNPVGSDLRNRAERVIQGGLRAVLGGQYTQNEGDRFIARAYDKNADELTNFKSLQRSADELETMVANKEAAVKWFQERKTMAGFTEALAEGKVGAAAPAPAAAPAGGVSRPASKADFDALPKGSRFIAPDGKEYIK